MVHEHGADAGRTWSNTATTAGHVVPDAAVTAAGALVPSRARLEPRASELSRSGRLDVRDATAEHVARRRHRVERRTPELPGDGARIERIHDIPDRRRDRTRRVVALQARSTLADRDGADESVAASSFESTPEVRSVRGVAVRRSLRRRRNPDALPIGTVAEYGPSGQKRTARIDARMMRTRTGALTGYLGETDQ